MNTTKLAHLIRCRAEDVRAAAEIDDPSTQTQRDNAELLNCLARMLEGKPIHKAFGAPGDWGYGTPIGDALLEAYQSPSDDSKKPVIPKLSSLACFQHSEDHPFRCLIEGPDGFSYLADGDSLNALIARFLTDDHVVRSAALASALMERARQNEKWGEQNHDLPTWSAILTEENGELAEAILHHKFGGPAASGVRMEAVQCAAVALQIVEFLDRTMPGHFLE